jgi:hypothetical protein
MPLNPHCSAHNPVSATMPAVPTTIGLQATANDQGDHVFGDVLGTISNGLMAIFGGGQNWQQRMNAYNTVLTSIWSDLSRLDYGHGANPPIVARTPAGAAGAEIDQHATVFGGYARRLQWQLAEVVCIGANDIRSIGADAAAMKAWRTAVLARFDDLMNHLVDRTALVAFLANGSAARTASHNEVHAAIALTAAKALVPANGAGHAAALAAPLASFGHLRDNFSALLDRFRDGYVQL